MRNPNFKYPDTKAYNFVIQRFNERGIHIKDLAQLVFDMQHEFEQDLTLNECKKETVDVLHKRELLNNAMVALELDRLANEDQLKEPLESIIKNDAGVFGVDETLALQIANIYGTIGATNFGYLDRVKKGIIKKIDQNPHYVNTFLDDLVAAIIAAVCGKVAHQHA